jgi:hypothetical protein
MKKRLVRVAFLFCAGKAAVAADAVQGTVRRSTRNGVFLFNKTGFARKRGK